MSIVQQIHYTERERVWWRLAEAMGFAAPQPPLMGWGEFHADGVLAVHAATDDRAAGLTDLHIIVPDLEAAATALTDFAVERSVLEGVGAMLVVTAASGVTLSVSEGAVQAGIGDIAVQPLWFQADLAEPRAILETLGFRSGITADRGGWVEMRGDGGSVGLHAGEPRIGLSFEARGNLDMLTRRLNDAGFAASVVDEAFGRTVRIADPDSGEEVWINGVQEDLYGYHRE